MSTQLSARIGVVTGLAAEAACFERAAAALPSLRRPILFCSGGGRQRAEAALRRMVDEGVGGLLSFGLAGGLDPALVPGTLVLADEVIGANRERTATDPVWRERVRAKAGVDRGLIVAPILGRDSPVTSVAEKKSLFASSGAAAADMESHVVAAAAGAAGLPFLCLRAIADPGFRAVPRAALAGLGPDGRMRPVPVLGQLVLRPWELPALLRLAGDAAAGFRALRRVAEAGALLGGP